MNQEDRPAFRCCKCGSEIHVLRAGVAHGPDSVRPGGGI